MSRYMILIHEREADDATITPEGSQSLVDAHSAFSKAVAHLGGTILGGEALQPTSPATSTGLGRLDRQRSLTA